MGSEIDKLGLTLNLATTQAEYRPGELGVIKTREEQTAEILNQRNSGALDWIDDVQGPWQQRRECDKGDNYIYFRPGKQYVEAAKEICSKCVVREDCLEFAVSNGERFGTWGGHTQREVRRLIEARKEQPL